MNKKTNEELLALVNEATAGDKKALETLITGARDIVFNLSLRMLGTFPDAEDATQDILLKGYPGNDSGGIPAAAFPGTQKNGRIIPIPYETAEWP